MLYIFVKIFIEWESRISDLDFAKGIINLKIDETHNMPTWFKEGTAEFIHGADEN